MNEFMMIFRNQPSGERPTPEQMEASIKKWQDWIGGIAAQGKFVATNALGFNGKTVQNGMPTLDGPYAEVKEIVGGYIIVKANSIEDAVKLTEGCPTLAQGGKVEVRDVMVINR